MPMMTSSEAARLRHQRRDEISMLVGTVLFVGVMAFLAGIVIFH